MSSIFKKPVYARMRIGAVFVIRCLDCMIPVVADLLYPKLQDSC